MMAKAPNEHSFAQYEAAIAELEQIVKSMETNELDLAKSLAQYQRGAALLKSCQAMLAQAQQEIKILNENNNLTVLKSQ